MNLSHSYLRMAHYKKPGDVEKLIYYMRLTITGMCL